jgi:hypothetical protein
MKDHSSSTRSCSSSGGNRRARSTADGHACSMTAHASRNPSASVGLSLVRSGWRRSNSASTSGPTSTPLMRTLRISPSMSTSSSHAPRSVAPTKYTLRNHARVKSTSSNRAPDRSWRKNSVMAETVPRATDELLKGKAQYRKRNRLQTGVKITAANAPPPNTELQAITRPAIHAGHDRPSAGERRWPANYRSTRATPSIWNTVEKIKTNADGLLFGASTIQLI